MINYFINSGRILDYLYEKIKLISWCILYVNSNQDGLITQDKMKSFKVSEKSKIIFSWKWGREGFQNMTQKTKHKGKD